jgi:glycosyltransferase involved in cell wall biosynthesis
MFDHRRRSAPSAPADLVCLSHLRWSFVFQRPQHLMTRFARERRVWFVEEPEESPGRARMEVVRAPEGVTVLTPRLPPGLERRESELAQRELLSAALAAHDVENPVLWVYTPMSLPVARRVAARTIVYDCMDELSLFKNAPPELLPREEELLHRADLVFTGGQSLWEAKRDRHPRAYAFPSSVDVPHFARARASLAEPRDQAAIPRPRIGFYGVVDERMDLALVEAVARLRPEWQVVIVGPVVKIDPSSLPRLPNLHWLGAKSYDELPAYLAGWDVAMMPFARNDATRFISPTKTPEFLAAGRPVVSTSIRDVVRPYGERGLVRIADAPAEFVRAVEESLEQDRTRWLPAVDALLAGTSWDATFARMRELVDEVARTGGREVRAASAVVAG